MNRLETVLSNLSLRPAAFKDHLCSETGIADSIYQSLEQSLKADLTVLLLHTVNIFTETGIIKQHQKLITQTLVCVNNCKMQMHTPFHATLVI